MSSSTVSDTHFMNTKIDQVVVIEKMNLNEAIQIEIGWNNIIVCLEIFRYIFRLKYKYHLTISICQEIDTS